MATSKNTTQFAQIYATVYPTVIQPRLVDGELRIRHGFGSIYVPAEEVTPILRHDGHFYLNAKFARVGHQ